MAAPRRKTEADAPGIERIRSWFSARGWTPWAFQEEAWAAYARGEGGLVQVPTGAGKTYAAYMGPLAELADEARAAGVVAGPRVLYITPLRAVSRDIEKALKAPVAELGLKVSVESRTGDTASSVRARQRERLPNVLVTTPESMSILLTRDTAPEQLASVRCVIVDEWHELLSSKRGSQTELALARLRRFAPGLRAWALSATLSNVEEAARAVVGAGPAAPTIIRAEIDRPVIIDSVLPRPGERFPWAGHMGLTMLGRVIESLNPEVATLLFTNTRSQAERWYQALRLTRPEWEPILGLHHGSIDRDARERIEAGLKSGTVRIVVATSSLDLGVDFSPVEWVFQIGSPKGVARLMQRAGRSSHRPGASCRVTCIPTHGMELFEIDAVRRAVDEGRIEPRDPLRQPLDVLVQHLVTCALGGGFTEDELFDEVRTAWSFRDLTREEFGWAMELVRDGGRTLAAYPDYHRIAATGGRYRVPSARLASLHRLNVGTITGEATVEIRYVNGRRLGSIEENFVSKLRPGEKFVFAGKPVSFVAMYDLVALVRPARGKVTYTPSWMGTKLPISESLGESVRRTLAGAGRGELVGPELEAARPLVEAQRAISKIPEADEVLAEVCRTREGHHLFLYPFEGRLVHAGLGALLALRITRRVRTTFSIAANDYGIELMTHDDLQFGELLTPEMFSRERLVEDALESVNISALARLQFRDIARVAGLVFQAYPGARRSARQLQASSGLIFDVFQEFDPENLLLRQARREVMERQFEQSRLARTLDRIAARGVTLVEVARPTPLGFPLVVERLGVNSLSAETILERIEKMRAAWEQDVDNWKGSEARRAAPAPRRSGTASRSRARRSS
ncbi:MAG: ligase-associated DNA damage response DEXH box helicase [Phycisphaerales bacterium]|nr:ligase-associated DNA damage response DEXH box helicase [Phycisphaerales bacterium]